MSINDSGIILVWWRIKWLTRLIERVLPKHNKTTRSTRVCFVQLLWEKRCATLIFIYSWLYVCIIANDNKEEDNKYDKANEYEYECK